MTGSPFKDAGTDDQSMAVDPAGKFAYVTSAGDNEISAFTIDPISGALRKVKGSPFKAHGQHTPRHIRVPGDGQQMYPTAKVKEHLE